MYKFYQYDKVSFLKYSCKKGLKCVCNEQVREKVFTKKHIIILIVMHVLCMFGLLW